MPIVKLTDFSRLVIDASVAVKWFSKEIYQRQAESVLKRAYQNKLSLFAPELLIYEVGNALWKGKQLDEERIGAALNSLYYLPLDFSYLSQSLIKAVVLLMVKYNLTFYDAVYAGLAYEISCPLLTSNPKDFQKISEIKTIDLAKL